MLPSSNTSSKMVSSKHLISPSFTSTTLSTSFTKAFSAAAYRSLLGLSFVSICEFSSSLLILPRVFHLIRPFFRDEDTLFFPDLPTYNDFIHPRETQIERPFPVQLASAIIK